MMCLCLQCSFFTDLTARNSTFLTSGVVGAVVHCLAVKCGLRRSRINVMARSEEVRCRLGLGLSLVWSDVVIRQPTAVCVFGEAVIVMVIVAVLQWSDPA